MLRTVARLLRRDPQVGQRVARDLLERRRRDLAAGVDAAAGLVDDHRDQQLRVARGREADERGDELASSSRRRARASARCRSCRRCRSRGPPPRARCRPGRARPRASFWSWAACAAADHALALARARRPARGAASRACRRSRSRRRRCIIWIGVTARPWPIGRFPIEEPGVVLHVRHDPRRLARQRQVGQARRSRSAAPTCRSAARRAAGRS